MSIHDNLIKWVILLRGINVSGHKIIKMELLRNILEKEGFKGVKTYIQSGNIVLKSTISDATILIEKIQQLIEKEFGYQVPTMVRKHDDYLNIFINNPFKDYVFDEKEKLYIGFMQQVPDTALKTNLEVMSNEGETVKIIDRTAYIVYKKDGRKHYFTNNFIERKLKVIIK